MKNPLPKFLSVFHSLFPAVKSVVVLLLRSLHVSEVESFKKSDEPVSEVGHKPVPEQLSDDFEESPVVSSISSKEAGETPVADLKITDQPTAVAKESQKSERTENFPVHLANVFAENEPTVKWLVPGLLPAGATVMIFGAPGSAKSFLALDLLHSLAMGRKFLGLDTVQSRSVYIPFEGLSGVSLRLKALKQEYGDLSDNFAIIRPSATLALPEAIDELTEKVRDYDVICIDTLSASSEVDENSNSEINKFLNQIKKLDPQRNKTIILIHHPGHADSSRMRGGMTLTAAADVIIQVSANSASQGEAKCRCINVTKMKDAAELEQVYFELKPVEVQTPFGATTSCVVKRISAHQWPDNIRDNMRVVVRSFLDISAGGPVYESQLLDAAAANLVKGSKAMAISAAKQKVGNSIDSLVKKKYLIRDDLNQQITLNDFDKFSLIVSSDGGKSEEY